MKRKTVEVLLINPPYFFSPDGSYQPNKGFWKPLGILYLASLLISNKVTVEVMDLMPRESNLKEIVRLIRKKKPRIIGITATTPQIRGLVQLGQVIKEKFGQQVFLLAGGPHVSCDPGFIKAFPFFDAVFVGEGEITFPQVVKKILSRKKVARVISGIPEMDLDKLPFPDRKLLCDIDYAEGPYGKDYVTIHTTRGCPFRCIYCSSPVEQISRVRYRSPENVVDEIEGCLKKYGTKFVIFTDDTFTLKKDRVEEICRLIIKRNLNFSWNCETRANLIDKKLLNLMKQAGCKEIFFGVESGSDRIRNEIINKRIKNRDLYRAFKMCRQLGIVTNAFLMAGFPTETKKELKETADFCFKVEPDVIGIHITGILPGSPIFNLAVKEGKIRADVWHKYARFEIKDQPVYVPEGMTLADLEDFQKQLYRKFYFRPKWLLRRLTLSLRSWYQFKTDFKIAFQLLTRGKLKARAYKEEDINTQI